MEANDLPEYERIWLRPRNVAFSTNHRPFYTDKVNNLELVEYVRSDSYDSLREQNRVLATALQEILNSGVEFDDERVSYIVMQVDRDAISQACAALKVMKVAKIIINHGVQQ